MIEFLDLPGEAAQALVFGGGSHGPIDFLAVRRAELNFVKAVLFVESDFAFELEFGFLDFLQQLLEAFFVFEVGFFLEAAFGKQFDEARLAEAAAEFGGGGLIFLNVQKKCGEAGAFEIHAFLGFDDVIFGGALHQLVSKFALIADVALGFAALHAIERRLGDIDVAALDELLHVAEEKSEQQSADVAAVDVGVGHENDFVIAQLGRRRNRPCRCRCRAR